jgi:hypothetical protein
MSEEKTVKVHEIAHAIIQKKVSEKVDDVLKEIKDLNLEHKPGEKIEFAPKDALWGITYNT